jgi:hypothetical protein
MYLFKVPPEFADPPLGMAFWHAQLYRYLFGRPTPELLAMVREAKAAMGWTPGMRVGAIHYRASDKGREAPIHELQEYVEALYGALPDLDAIYIAADVPESMAKIDKLWYLNNKTIRIMHMEAGVPGQNTRADVFRDIYLLSSGDAFAFTVSSNLGYMALMLAWGHQSQCLPLAAIDNLFFVPNWESLNVLNMEPVAPARRHLDLATYPLPYDAPMPAGTGAGGSSLGGAEASWPVAAPSMRCYFGDQRALGLACAKMGPGEHHSSERCIDPRKHPLVYVPAARCDCPGKVAWQALLCPPPQPESAGATGAA